MQCMLLVLLVLALAAPALAQKPLDQAHQHLRGPAGRWRAPEDHQRRNRKRAPALVAGGRRFNPDGWLNLSITEISVGYCRLWPARWHTRRGKIPVSKQFDHGELTTQRR